MSCDVACPGCENFSRITRAKRIVPFDHISESLAQPEPHLSSEAGGLEGLFMSQASESALFQDANTDQCSVQSERKQRHSSSEHAPAENRARSTLSGTSRTDEEEKSTKISSSKNFFRRSRSPQSRSDLQSHRYDAVNVSNVCAGSNILITYSTHSNTDTSVKAEV